LNIIKEVQNPDVKSAICNEILRALPDWFGIEESIIDYVKQVQSMPFYVAYKNEKTIGFVALKIHNPYAAEVCIMGVISEYHGHGIGKDLILCCENYCIENKIEFLTVKTLDESRECEEYNKTRLFYLSQGFKPLEVFPLLWGEDNPCLFMAKYLGLKE
jgi:N-acetylglutamate synthase-like GNAT family acetyltransferase